MKNRLAIGLLLLLCFAINAEVMDFSIGYLGIGVVDVRMTDRDHCLTVTAKSTSVAGIFAEMDNTYISEYGEDYLPLRYSKDVRQDGYCEDRTTRYERDSLTAYRVSRIDSARSISYPIKAQSRDFFSALFYLRWANLDSLRSVPLDANSLVWTARIAREETEEIGTILGKVTATCVRIDFTRSSDREKERSDMLTNNLVNEEVPMYIWLTCDERRIPIKAKFDSSPFSVTWKLTGYTE